MEKSGVFSWVKIANSRFGVLDEESEILADLLNADLINIDEGN